MSEAVQLTVGDIRWGSKPAVHLVGKGNKARWCPLWPHTEALLKQLVAGRGVQDRVFHNRLNQPLTRYGIYRLVQRTVAQAGLSMPSLKDKRVSPHCLRHTCAVHLLRSGVDINTIRAWLGHVSLDTTHVYAEVDLEMKAKALAQCDLPENLTVKPWHTDTGLIGFLKTLRSSDGEKLCGRHRRPYALQLASPGLAQHKFREHIRGVSPQPASWPCGRHAARAVGTERRGGALPRAGT